MFGALHWAALIEPPQSGDMVLSLLSALAGAGALIALPERLPDGSGARSPASWPSCCSSWHCSPPGVPLRTLGPHGWDDLVARHEPGDQLACRRSRCPTAGVDEWVRIAILSGGTALLALAALLAFWPRRGGTDGYPIAAAVALGTLYAVPIVEHGPTRPYLDGALFCILLVAFLWLERVRSDQVGRRRDVRARRGVGAASSPRRWTAPGRGSTTSRSPRSSSPARPRRSSGTTATGR